MGFVGGIYMGGEFPTHITAGRGGWGRSSPPLSRIQQRACQPLPLCSSARWSAFRAMCVSPRQTRCMPPAIPGAGSGC